MHDVDSGVWAVLNADQNAIERVYSEKNELAARRSIDTQGYWQRIIFVPWGVDVMEAVKKI